jgi:hypothetical protein
VGAACSRRMPLRVRPLYGSRGACLEPAEPGRLIRLVVSAQAWARADISDPLPVCTSCYTTAPLAGRTL